MHQQQNSKELQISLNISFHEATKLLLPIECKQNFVVCQHACRILILKKGVFTFMY